MDGYLGRAPQDGAWHTGDMGRLEDGRLTVLGRRDGMILRASGRNIAPEWVEAEALADPAIPVAALLLTGEDRLVLVLGAARQPDLAALQTRLGALPVYARPDALLIVDPRSDGLIRPSGTADRRVAATLVANNPIALIDLTLPETAA
jgi:non-ribosomal peptide synthetase component E (peptide arylation enzyme)